MLLTINAIFGINYLFERVVGLRAYLHCFRERFCTSWQQHEFLECKLVAGVRATVDDVEARDGKHIRRLNTSELCEVLIEWDTLCQYS